MSTYRCPICGANHKDNVAHCRLCGADMTGRPLPVDTGIGAPPPIPPAGSVKGIVFIGIGLVLVLALGAVFFGFIRNTQVETVATNVFGKHTDGWTTQNEPDETQPGGTSASSGSVGRFSVELPGDRIRETIDFTGTNDGKLTVWTAKIGDDMTLQAGWGNVTPPPPGSGPEGTFKDQGPTRQIFLRELAANWMKANGINAGNVSESTTFFGGMPAYSVKTQTANTKLKDKPAYTQIAFGLNGDKLYVLIVTSVFRPQDTDQLDKMQSTFQLTG